MARFNINGAEKEYPIGITLEAMAEAEGLGRDRPVMAAIIGNMLFELTAVPEPGSRITFIDSDSEDGNRIYARSLSFMLVRAVKAVLPGARLRIEHSLHNGLYCEINKEAPLTSHEVAQIQLAMEKIAQSDEPFVRGTVSKRQAMEYFEADGQHEKNLLLRYREDDDFTLYENDGIKNYFYGFMAPSTGYIRKFSLYYYPPGFVMIYPKANGIGADMKFIEQPRLAKIFREAGDWARILECDYISDLNDMARAGKLCEFIRINEALHEKKVAEIANNITSHGKDKKLILISGPSSSGKTTFAQRLMVQLRVQGKKPVSISLDNYYKNRDEIEHDSSGNADLESTAAIAVDIFNSDISELIAGREVELPVFNFAKGHREHSRQKMRLGENEILIVEGIHALNPELARCIDSRKKYRIYVSAIAHINLDDYNRIPTTDIRLIRRMVRDSKYRGANIQHTIDMWPRVRRGEENNIFPYQENADIMFNSALFYELCLLKKYVYPMLKAIGEGDSYYTEANRLIRFLNYVMSSDEDYEVPRNSILREFIGGSSFYE